eukprot:TRINITY_DN94675_c0_g1_i1.p1 TRINITY_DN94675_c0_g1~~TRINITY_DN94675_c0_g1_i1.p1  ORF type:complete len:505 (-),score=123.69 TRINITY_DN94675_c0_g1_i1:67-1557(-)
MSFADSGDKGDVEEECSKAALHSKALRSMLSGFLFKVFQRSLPLLLPVVALDLEEDREADKASPKAAPQRLPRSPSSLTPKLRLCYADGSATSEVVIGTLCGIAKDAAALGCRPLLNLLEEMDLGDPQGDGGGDLEVSPLCLASFVVLAEQGYATAHKRLVPQVLPICLSATRRANILLRTCFVLLSNCDAGAPGVVNLADLSGPVGDDPMEAASAAGVDGDSSRRSPCYAQRGLALFVSQAVPTLQLAAKQSPGAFSALSSPHCRWHPGRTFRKVLESLAATPDIEQAARGAIFQSAASAMKVFGWSCRCQLYLDIVNSSRVDAIIGAVVTLFKDDWWPLVVEKASMPPGCSLGEERSQLVKMMNATLSGDVQIIDGMDTLTAALNIARLVALASSPAAAFLRNGLRKGSAGSIDLEAMLNNISKQIDAELGLLGHEKSTATNGLSAELAEAMGAVMGKDGNISDMKRERINMVAHLVSRVREVMSEAPEVKAQQ